jgi:DNA-binding transcriptional LysR family regulator
VRQEAPRIQLDVRLVEQPEGLAIERGDTDLAVLQRVEERPGLYMKQLFTDRFQCMVRADHPAVGRRLTLERYLELSHLLISPQGQGRGFVDAALAQRGLSRHVALRVPYFLAAPLIVARTDLVLTLPERVARLFVDRFPLRLVAPPLELSGFTMNLVWHERCHDDGGHRWLRDLMLGVMQEGLLPSGE